MMDIQSFLSLWDLQHLKDALASMGFWAPFLGFALSAVRPSLPFPLFIPINIALGAVFGFWLGSLLGWGGTCLGCCIGFSIARKLGKPVVYSWLRGERWQKLEVWVEQRGFAAVFLARTTPIAPMGPFSYIVGVSPMSFGGYALATAIASLPMTMIATGAGDFLKGAPWWAWAIGIFLYGGVNGFLILRTQQQAKAATEADAAVSET
jgi:uncharacterized membrane protein YdjX (TVP38/TMEM64 family)